jgi:hypothetical protein
VVVRWLIRSVAALALLVGGCGGSDDSSNATSTTATKESTQSIAGQWTGKLTQGGLPPFRVAVAIFSSGGKVAYTGIDCAGDWKLEGGRLSTGSYVFRETITSGAGGNCKGTGRVHLEHLASNRLQYRFEGGGVTSRGFLHRTDAAGLKPVFDEAGVTPP